MKLGAKTIIFGTLVLYPASLAVCLTGKTVEVPERFTKNWAFVGDLLLMRLHGDLFPWIEKQLATD
jgi:hypothetical protein